MGAGKSLMCSESNLAKDLTGTTIVVTGGNSGIGLSTCKQLTLQGANIIIACRRPAAGETAAAECNSQDGAKGKASVMTLDVSDLSSVRAFAADFKKDNKKLDILVNNAGIMGPAFSKTVDGFESQIGTNHFGHFLLTNLLLNEIKKGKDGGRVISVSSAYHHKAFDGSIGHIDFEDMNFEKRKYAPYIGYTQSKLANLLFAKEMAVRHPGITTLSVHPGFVRSELLKGHAIQKALMAPIFFCIGRIEPWAGVQTHLHTILESKGSLENGAYYSQHQSPKGIDGAWPITPGNPEASDADIATKLWDHSVKAVGLQNNIL